MNREKQSIWSSHTSRMILCCAIPLGGIVLLTALGIFGSWGFYALILLCPLLHFLLMRRTASRNGHGRSSKTHSIEE